MYEQEKVILGRRDSIIKFKGFVQILERVSFWGDRIWGVFEKGIGNIVCGLVIERR